MSVWIRNPELVEKLRQYWANGMTAPVMAAALGHGITPRAVRAKALTLGLGKRRGGFTLPYQVGMGVSTRKEKTAPEKLSLTPEDAPAPIGPIGDFPSGRTCRFIHGEVSSGEWRCCGHPGLPWCEYHQNRFCARATGKSSVNQQYLRNSGFSRFGL